MANERSRYRLTVIIAVLIFLSVLGVVTFRFMEKSAATLEAFGPHEFAGPAAAKAFEREFPTIHHFVAEDDRYEVTSFRVLRGLGGRWGKLVLTRRINATGDRKQVVDKLLSGLTEHDWKLPARDRDIAREGSDIFDARREELSPDDLRYSHAALADERQHVFHNIRVFVSADAKRIVAYCEMGW